MAQQNKDTNELIKVRRQKLADLQAAGKNPFEIMKYDVTHHSKEIKDNFEELEGKEVAVAGRLMFKRVMGKASFCNVQDLQGGIQALSRSYFTKIIPAEKSGEYFGLMDICGKGASFMGTTIVSLVSQITGNINAGVGMIAVLFVAGIILFRKSVSLCNTEKGEEVYPAPEMPQRSSI